MKDKEISHQAILIYTCPRKIGIVQSQAENCILSFSQKNLEASCCLPARFALCHRGI